MGLAEGIDVIFEIAISLGAAILLLPDLPDLLGQCEVIAALDDARRIGGMPPVPHLPGLDDMCIEAERAIGSGVLK